MKKYKIIDTDVSERMVYMSNQFLGLFDIPELPGYDGSKESFGSSNINYFITKTLPRTLRTIEFLESTGPEFDQWVEEHRGDTDRSFFIEQLSVWRQELLPWRAMIAAADECSQLPETQACVHHGGTRNQCLVDLPLMWSSNDGALTHLKKVCILQSKKKNAADGKPIKNNGEYKISPNRPDLVADVLIESGWRFAVAGAYTRGSDGSLLENDKGEHVLMWDYDKKCFTDAFNPNAAGFSAPMRALNTIVAGGLNASFFTVLHRAFVSRLVEAHGQSVFVTDSIPSHIVPVGNGDYNVILQRLYPMSPFHAPKERIETLFEDWSDKEPPRYGTHGKTWDDLLDDWSTTTQGTVHTGRRLHLEQIAYQILLGYNAFDSIFILSGEGSDGKSTFVNTLGAVIGQGNVSTATIDTLSTRSKDAEEVVLSLGFKYALLGSDTSSSFTIDHTAYLKSLASGEGITVVPKYRSAVNTSFSGMMVQPMNGFPQLTESATLAMDRRLQYVIFENPQVFSKDTSANDPSIIEDLSRPENLRYLLWRYLSGRGSAGLTYSSLAAVDNRLALTRMGASDSAATFVQWLEDHGVLDGSAVPYLPKNTLRAVYGAYMDQEYDNQFLKSYKTFFSIVTNELAARGYVPDVDDKGREKRYRTTSFFARQGAPFVAALRRAGLSDAWISDLTTPRSESFNYGETRAFVFKQHKVRKSYRPASPVQRVSFGRFFTSLGSQHALYCEARGVNVNDASTLPVLYNQAEHVDRVIPREFVPAGMSDLFAGFLHDLPYLALHMVSGQAVRVLSAMNRYLTVMDQHGCPHHSSRPGCLFPHELDLLIESLSYDVAACVEDGVAWLTGDRAIHHHMSVIVPELLKSYTAFMELDGFAQVNSLETMVHHFCADYYQVFGFGPGATGQRFPRSLAHRLCVQWLDQNHVMLDDVTDDRIYSHLDAVFDQQGFSISEKKKLSAWAKSEGERIGVFPDNVRDEINKITVKDTKFYEKRQM